PRPSGVFGRLSLSSFFFPAADGIRVLFVSGFQPCALPISFRACCWPPPSVVFGFSARCPGPSPPGPSRSVHPLCWCSAPLAFLRSEERRVGKVCSSRVVLCLVSRSSPGCSSGLGAVALLCL